MNIGDDSDYDYEADRRDAERYRWLRDNKATAMLANMREHIKAPWVDPEPALDAAVDHALGVTAIGLPERRKLPEREGSTYFRALGWNECLDEIAQRNAGVVTGGEGQR